MGKRTWITAAAAIAATAGVLVAGPAQARTSVSIGLSTGGYYAPPAYVVPQPVYTQPAYGYAQPGYAVAQPPVVYTQPSYVYAPPPVVPAVGFGVVVGPRYVHHGWHHYRHWR